MVDAGHEDFKTCIESFDLVEVHYKGSPFTWWNGRVGDDCIFERLDRILINSNFQELHSHIEVEHLSRNSLDHAPLLLNCENSDIGYL